MKKALLLFTLFLSAAMSTDTIEYPLAEKDSRELQAAYQKVMDNKANYETALERLKESIKAVDEKLEAIKQSYGESDRHTVSIRGKVVEVRISQRQPSSGNSFQPHGSPTGSGLWSTATTDDLSWTDVGTIQAAGAATRE